MELDPVQLNRDIGQLETEAARLAIELATVKKTFSQIARRYRYLFWASRLRKPSAAFHLWPLATLLVAPLIAGFLLTIVVGVLISSSTVLFSTFAIGALATAILVAALLRFPSNSVLAATLPQVEQERQFTRGHYEELQRQTAEVEQQLKTLRSQRQQLAATEKLPRAMLLQRNWKAMRGVEWEDYLVEVCRTLGAHVERTANAAYVAPGSAKPVATGRKANLSPANHLIVTLSPRRIAVAPVAGINPFHPAAAQQTLNELATYDCDATAIISNVRLTAGTRELAAHRHSTLIGEDEFPDFVLGKLNL